VVGVLRALGNPLRKNGDLARGEGLLGFRGRHAFVGIGGGDAAHQLTG
jgi:hypothetical protein